MIPESIKWIEMMKNITRNIACSTIPHEVGVRHRTAPEKPPMMLEVNTSLTTSTNSRKRDITIFRLADRPRGRPVFFLHSLSVVSLTSSRLTLSWFDCDFGMWIGRHVFTDGIFGRAYDHGEDRSLCGSLDETACDHPWMAISRITAWAILSGSSPGRTISDGCTQIMAIAREGLFSSR
jgi:hypothetical protein